MTQMTDAGRINVFIAQLSLSSIVSLLFHFKNEGKKNININVVSLGQ